MIYKYELPEQFSGLEKTNFAQFSGNIVLWGAGKIGSIVAHIFKQKGIKALAFIDSSPLKQGTEFFGLKVISPDTFFQDYGNTELVITTVDRDNVIDELTAHNFKAYYDVWPLLLEFDFTDYDYQNQMYMTRMIDYYFRTIARSLNLKNPYLVNRLRVMVTSRCSLRCKECSTFVPYVQNPQDDDWEKIVEDIKFFLDAVGKLQEIELFGGEPLLHLHLDKIVGCLKEEKRIKQISIISNGTIFPSQSLIDALQNDPRTIFRMSSYGKLSTKIERIEKTLYDKGIRYEVIDYKTWYKNSEIKLLNETDAELRKKFECCMQGSGLVCWMGKVFFCVTLPFLIEQGALPKADDNFFDMRNNNFSRSHLIEELHRYAERSNTDNYVDACRFCTGKSSTNFEHAIPVAEQVNVLLKVPPIFDDARG